MVKKSKNNQVSTEKSANIFENLLFLSIKNNQKFTTWNNPAVNSFVLYDREKTKVLITKDMIKFGPFWKKAIKRYEDDKNNNKETIEKTKFLLMWYSPETNSVPVSENLTYNQVLNTIPLNNIVSIATLCSIEKIEKEVDSKGEIMNVATVKAIHKYIPINIYGYQYLDENGKIVKKANKEAKFLRDISGVEAIRASYKTDEEILSGDPALDINGFESIITSLIENSNWSSALHLYRHLRGFSTDEILAWNREMFQTQGEFLASDNNSKLEAIVSALCNLFALPTYEKHAIYTIESPIDKYQYLKTLYSSIVDVISIFINACTNEERSKISHLISSIKDNDLYRSAIEDIKSSDNQKIYDEYVVNFYNEYYNYFKSGLVTKEDRDYAINLIEKNKDKKLNDQNSKSIPEIDKQIDKEINRKIQSNLDKQQKEFLLREKMKVIKEQLNENDAEEDEDSDFLKIANDPILNQIYPKNIIKSIKTEKEKLKGMMSSSPDANILQTYISNLKKLPWRKVEIENLDINHAKSVLDKNHYGLKEVKERVIEYLSLIINHKNINKENSEKELITIDENTQIDLGLFKENSKNKVQQQFNNVPILTLVGPPGTGKTSLARSIAEALDKSYVKISLGGVHDESEIRGHRKTYVGAMPGKIIKAIQSSGVSNPLILLDEIDKMSSDIKGDPASAMLEVLDPEQNTKFQDNYIEHEYDLSKVLFIATANYYENIPAPLLDRVEIIELNSYTVNEKIKIAREHLIDIVVKQAGLKNEQFQIGDDVLEFIIKHYTAESGVRALKRNLDKIARKIVTKIVSGEKLDEFKITINLIPELLGTIKISDSDNEKTPQIGSVNGLAYTSIGGTTLQIEVSAFESKSPGIRLTGSLKDVMQESAKIALSYVRTNAEKFGIKDFDFDTHEIHIHVPEGAVPKDGPSAGVTFTTALISALTQKPVSQEVAMTGEITLRGKVLEIGGLKEKSFAAFKKGIKNVFIPKNNEKNLKDLPEEVLEAIKFIPVREYEEIWEILFKNTLSIKNKKTVEKSTKKQDN
ncbi:endopeptidase La [Mycoplasma sp. U97]|uniref:endopeptidase La n=1 Tax=Mycoplasma tauri TaxID=547987 RepID=UPI001E004D70|nr:endopeptidase La [Mycoplasma tauri]